MNSTLKSLLLVLVLVVAGMLMWRVRATRQPEGAPSVESATKFLADVNYTMLRLGNAQNQAGWVAETYITDDTAALNAKAQQDFADAVARFAKASTRFDAIALPPDLRRQLDVLKVSLVLATPSDPKASEELTKIAAGLDASYGKGKWCADPAKPDTCLDIEKITEIMATSRDPKRLREVWEGWQTVGQPMKASYARFVTLSNTGAKELGFADTGAMWRSKYDMPPDDFTKELDRLWGQVQPLYRSLHAYVRMKLHEKYGDAVPATGPIPAHLLGNIWAQDWSNIADLVAPKGADPGYSLTKILEARRYDAKKMVETGEHFYVSLGFAPLPKTFWERSMLVKPRDRDVVCHASAWDIDNVDDVRIKMCVDPTD